MFAFWPQLAVEVNSEETTTPETDNNPSLPPSRRQIDSSTPLVKMVPAICNVRLVWPDHNATNKIFRIPDDFQPNINFI